MTNMEQMFRNASTFNQPIGNWNVSSVTLMHNLFNGAATFNQAIGEWDVSSVTHMGNMFSNASSFNQPIGDRDVYSVTLMHNLFNGATAFNQAIADWDVSKVTNMAGMFNGASSFDWSELAIGMCLRLPIWEVCSTEPLHSTNQWRLGWVFVHLKKQVVFGYGRKIWDGYGRKKVCTHIFGRLTMGVGST